MQMTTPVESRWRKTDKSDRLINCPGHEGLWLVYARIYTVGQNYSYSRTNNLISNLKSLPGDPSRSKYKKEAIQTFADEVCRLLSTYAGHSISLVPMPPSKSAGEPDYDDRIDQVAANISNRLSHTKYLPLLYRTRSVPCAHQNPQIKRSPSQIYGDLSINESIAVNYDEGACLMILDDVLTSGAHFSAARQRLLDRFPNADVRGLFWAKAQTA